MIIPYQILIASILTLILLLNKLLLLNKDIDYTMSAHGRAIMSVLCGVASFYWAESLFYFPHSWYALSLSISVCASAFVIYMFTHKVKKEEHKTESISLFERKGHVTYYDNSNFLFYGVFDDGGKENVIFKSNIDYKIGDTFSIDRYDGEFLWSD